MRIIVTYNDSKMVEYDDFDKVYRHRGETVRLNYLNMSAHPDRCNYSEIHDQYLLSEHSQWRDDLRDYVFGGEYSHLNDVNRIEQRIKDNEEYEKERESRRSRRGSSVSQRILEAFSNTQNEIDVSSLYQQYVDQIRTDYLSTQTESTEE